MIVTVQDILIDAMGLCGVIAQGEDPTAAELAQALRTANVMIDRWSSQRLMLRSTTTVSFPTVIGKSSYTIGTSGCDITASKPIKVYSAYYRDSTGLDTGLEVLGNITDYNNLTDKSTSVGAPMYLAYDPKGSQETLPSGTLYVYYAPDQVYTVFMEADLYLTEFVNLGDTVTFEPAYYEALIYNLAVRLFRFYRDAAVPIPQDIVAIAGNALSNIKVMNAITIRAGSDLPCYAGKYNIFTDGAA